MDSGTEESQIGDARFLRQFLLTENTATVQTQQDQPGLEQHPNVAMERPIIWQGILEWHEKQIGSPEGQKIPHQVPCHVTANVVNGESEVKGDVWPQKLIMILIPNGILRALSQGFIEDVKRVLFELQPCESLPTLTRIMDNGFVGCVHFTGANMSPNCTIKVLILLYIKVRDEYIAFIPNDQPGFVDRLRKVIQQQHPSITANNQSGLQQQPTVAGEKTTIWQGFLVWHEELKGPPEGQNIPRQVTCHVTTLVVNGEAEVKGDGWPPKLIMQLIPKETVGSLGGGYVMDAKTVVFMLQPCEALQSLTTVMQNGFVGCVHFPGTNMNPNCTVKVLILVYCNKRNAYLGFIPNDQPGFVDRIREFIQQQKSQQASMRQHLLHNLPMGVMSGSPVAHGVVGMVQQHSPDPREIVARNLPFGIHPQLQQGNMPIGQGNISNMQTGGIGGMQQGRMSMQGGNMPHGNMPGQMGQSGMQGNIQAGNCPSSMEGNMPPWMQHSNMQTMQSGIQQALQSASMSQSKLQQTLQQILEAATVQQVLQQQRQRDLVSTVGTEQSSSARDESWRSDESYGYRSAENVEAAGSARK